MNASLKNHAYLKILMEGWHLAQIRNKDDMKIEIEWNNNELLSILRNERKDTQKYLNKPQNKAYDYSCKSMKFEYNS